MKKIIISVLFLFQLSIYAAEEDLFTGKNASIQPSGYGCEIKNKIYPVGTRKQMNHKDLALYKKRTGYTPSDGYAIMMECLYIVNPLHDDHPKVEDRMYVWVAS